MKYLSAAFSIHCAVLLAVIALGLSLWIQKQAGDIGPDVGARFLERGESYDRALPARAESRRGATPRVLSKSNDTEAIALRRWAAANAGSASAPGAALKYANPILIVYDVAFLLAFGLFLMIATLRMASEHVIGWFNLPPRLVWLFALLPAVYMLADLAEDLLLWRFLTDRAWISGLLVGIAQTLTHVKIYSAIGAMLVLGAVALLAMAHSVMAAPKRK